MQENAGLHEPKCCVKTTILCFFPAVQAWRMKKTPRTFASGRLFFSLVSACFRQDGSQMRKSMSIRKKVGKRSVTDQSM